MSFRFYVKLYHTLIIVWVLSVVSLALLPGCQRQDPGEILKARALEYWNLVNLEDTIRAYEFEYPIYRKKVSVNQYVKRFSPFKHYRDISVSDIKFQPGEKTADVTMQVLLEIKPPVGQGPFIKKVEFTDRWIKIDDNNLWYHVPKSSKKKSHIS
jgi:hypothetical protein